MRMRDLAAASGLPRTTIHYYLREGLLPPAEKTASNSGTYGPHHLERLGLIRALRSPELGPFGLRDIRWILDRVDAGMDPELAAMTCGVAKRSSEDEAVAGQPADVAEFAGLSEDALSGLLSNGLLIPGVDGELDAADATAARQYAEILERTGLEPDDLAPIADLLHELSRYEETLSRVAAARTSGDSAETVFLDLHRMFLSVHEYLIIRHRTAESE